MSLALAATVLLSLTRQERIYLVGGNLSQPDRLSLQQAFGPQVVLTCSGLENLPERTTADRVLVCLQPDVRSAKWRNGIDAFVPSTRGLLKRLEIRFPNAQRDLVLGVPRSDEERVQVRPLLSQAAREAGWRTLDLGSSGVSGPTWRRLYALIAPVRHNPGTWRVLEATSEETEEGPAANAIDGNPDTYWHTRWSSKPTKVPHELVIDLGTPQEIRGFSYLSRQDGGVNGRVKGFELYVSNNLQEWASPVIKGELANTSQEQRLLFEKPSTGRYVRFRALSEVNGNIWTTCAELGILQ